MKYRIEIQLGTAAEAFAGIKDDWQALFAVSEGAPFLSWEWMSVWFDQFGEDREPVILKAYRGETLAAILPMFRETKRFAGMSLQKLALMGEGIGGADHLDVISRPCDKSQVLDAILAYLNEHERCETISFEALDQSSATLNVLKQRAATSGIRHSRVSENVASVCPQIDLAAGWEAVLKAGKRSDNFKRKLKKIGRESGFEFRSVTSPTETDAAFVRFLRLHEKRWENAGGSELSGHPRLISFQRRVVAELSAAGMIRFDELWLGGECRGSIYGLDDGTTFYYYNSGYDLEFSNLSVGLVLLGLSVQNAVERGVTLYDFLRGDETYKSDWANRRVELINFRISRPTAAVFAGEVVGGGISKLKAAAKAAIPQMVAEPLANWQRSWSRNYQLSQR
ncbi:MAG: GNAT family N-acetyltransferase [Acidobacteria bacterium]|nr:GNAT family N-acetyltransferase [Acidobacteriota bacterium]